MIRYLVGTQYEVEIFGRVYSVCPKGSIELVGVKGEHIEETKEEDILVDIGYAVGCGIPVGTLVEPICAMGDGEAVRIDPLFPVERRACFSMGGEVPKYRHIRDGRLFEIAKKPHKRIYSIKIISQDKDGLWDGDMHEGAWEVIAGYLGEYLKEE